MLDKLLIKFEPKTNKKRFGLCHCSKWFCSFFNFLTTGIGFKTFVLNTFVRISRGEIHMSDFKLLVQKWFIKTGRSLQFHSNFLLVLVLWSMYNSLFACAFTCTGNFLCDILSSDTSAGAQNDVDFFICWEIAHVDF